MQHDFDVLVIGGNADGLALAARLAKSGRRVALLEDSTKVGGELLTESFLTHHRFNLSGGWMLGEHLPPLDISASSARNIRLLRPEIPFAFLFEGQEPLVFHRSIERLTDQLDRADRARVTRLFELGERVHKRVHAALSGDAQAQSSARQRESAAMLSNMTTREMLDSYGFTDTRLRCALTYLPLAFGHDVEAKGSGAIAAYLLFGLTQLSIVDGGSALIAAALADSIIANGGIILESARVANIVSHVGRPQEIELQDGRRLSAAAIVRTQEDRVGNLRANATAPAAASASRPDQSLSKTPQSGGVAGVGSHELGIYRLYLGLAHNPGGFSGKGAAYHHVNRAYMVALGFNDEADIYAYLQGARAGQPPFVAGHVIANGHLDPISPTGALGLRSGQLWCTSCHTRDVQELRGPFPDPSSGLTVETSDAPEPPLRPATGALVWQSILPMRSRAIDPDGFRKSFEQASSNRLLARLEGVERQDVTFRLSWLPAETREPLQRIDLLKLAERSDDPYRTAQHGIYIDPHSRLAAFTGMATAQRLCRVLQRILAPQFEGARAR